MSEEKIKVQRCQDVTHAYVTKVRSDGEVWGTQQFEKKTICSDPDTNVAKVYADFKNKLNKVLSGQNCQLRTTYYGLSSVPLKNGCYEISGKPYLQPQVNLWSEVFGGVLKSIKGFFTEASASEKDRNVLHPTLQEVCLGAQIFNVR